MNHRRAYVIARLSIQASIAAIAASAIAAHAQDTTPPSAQTVVDAAVPVNDASKIGDIIVTAERRASSVQRTPIAITAVGGDALRANGISSIEGLNTSVPNLTFARDAGDAKIFIRGVGYNSIAPGGETRVALYLDGVYQSRTQAALLAFYDVDRLEVLRGPQGTLYGRNAIAGTINLITRDPGDKVEGYVTGSVGNFGLVGIEGAVGGPLSSTLQARVAVRSADRGGYGRNLTTGEAANDEHTRSIRGKLKFEPSSALTVRLIGDYTREDDHSGGYYFISAANPGIVPLGNLVGGVVPTNKQDFAGFGPKNDTETFGLSGQADLDLGGDTRLALVSGYRFLAARLQSNVDVTTANLSRQYITERSKVFSQEARLSHRFGSFADLVVGGYYFHETNSARNEVPFKGSVIKGRYSPFAPIPPVAALDPNTLYDFYGTFGQVKTDALAAFAQANVHLTPQLELDLGVRYSHEVKRIVEQFQIDVFSPFVQGDPVNPKAFIYGADSNRVGYNSFDPKATLSWQASDHVYLYATYSRGFKAGGFNIGGIQAPFKPEKLTNYEAGIKADLFDRRLRTNVAVFNYDYKQLQVNIVEPPASLVTRNAASARIRGIEAEITALPVDDLRLKLNFAYLDAKYRRFVDTDPSFPALGEQDLTGNRLTNAPKYQIDGDVGYTFHTGLGDFTPRVNVAWIDEIFFDQFNNRQLYQPSRTQVDLLVNWSLPGKGLSASAYVKNLIDDTYVTAASVSSGFLGSPVVGQYGAPRTFGLTVTKNF